ncbi:unnamed protein product (macronuclear) [Paramecium tetraurelia]|uniref:Uncharacterized protein n=1 Tax=Paramecium tetraurelia TaxID=5888 RepID=A0CM31_PARTE|nr:uncharacterized protein GSPATT00008327001 [Paramecium tetraurelia]CAK71848.1 unnamed protein product [Paramecium tetraurelia]|eukprot:XP_001439245.1 hypothetical protein (macronuclear) [Paramecium tetraurelia strain d4-2]
MKIRLITNGKDRQIKLQCLDLLNQKMKRSHSYDLPYITVLSSGQQLKKQPKSKTMLLIANSSNYGNSARKSLKSEKHDLMDAISLASQLIQEAPPQKTNIRRASQYDYISLKQRRLDSFAPLVFVQQHSQEAMIRKKKKLTQRKMQYKFMKRSMLRKQQRVQRSKSALLPQQIKIKHKRAKTVMDQLYQGPILRLDTELEKKIRMLVYSQRCSRLILKRKTFIQEPQNNIFVSRDKLLRYQEVMANKFVKLINKCIQDQADSSCDSSPQIMTKIQFKKTQFSKIQVGENTISQYLTPRLQSDCNLNIFSRNASHSVIAQYVQNYIDKNKAQKRSVRGQQKLAMINQPSLNEFNKQFLAQKRSVDVGRISSQLKLSRSQDNGNKQIQLNQKQSQFINKQKNIMIQQKSDSQFNQNIRIRTLPSDISLSKSKISLQQRLRPYLK